MAHAKISVVGTGYVGLCTAVGFASKGHRVITSTHDAQKAELISNGVPPFHEPNLRETLQKTVQNGRLQCTVGRLRAIQDSDITFIAVGTPSRLDGSIDLRLIDNAAVEIGEALRTKKTWHLIVVKSTVTPGTSENVVKPLLERHSGKECGVDFGLCMNPEFLRQGAALKDTLEPDRIVIGEYDKNSGNALERLYKDFHGAHMPPLIRTGLSTAELIKYANNAFLATKISYINTIASLCEKIPGADVTLVAKSIGLDRRIGPLFLNAGLGYGGSCFPKDVKALLAYSRSIGQKLGLLEAVENVNQAQSFKAVELCKRLLGDMKGRHVAILGLSFKPDTDDMREARSIPIIDLLVKEGATVTAYDPVAIPAAKRIFETRINYASTPIECLKNADCCILVTEWDEFKKLSPKDFKQNMRNPILIDGRRIFNSQKFGQELKFAAVGLGKQTP